jgi:hypothetical protein
VRYISGLVAGKGNLLKRGTLTQGPGAEDSLFPRANIGDGLPSSRFRWTTAAGAEFWIVDLNEVLNSGFESSLANWGDASTGTGVGGVTITSVGAEVHSGTKAVKLAAGAGPGTAQAYQGIVVRSGERRFVDAWAKVTSGTARIQIYNTTTGRTLKNDGTWAAGANDVLTSTNGSYANLTKQYQVEPFSVCQSPLVTLLISVYTSTAGGVCFFDDVTDQAAWNFLSIHGHNIAPITAAILNSSTDGFSANSFTEANLTPYQNAFFAYLSTPVYKRWAAMQLVGVNPSLPWFGEAILGYAETLSHNALDGMSEDFEDPQLRSAGGEYTFLQRAGDVWGLTLPFEHVSENELSEVLEMWRRARFGGDTTVIVPRDTGTRVSLGRLQPAEGIVYQDPVVRANRLQLVPLPIPSIVN